MQDQEDLGLAALHVGDPNSPIVHDWRSSEIQGVFLNERGRSGLLNSWRDEHQSYWRQADGIATVSLTYIEWWKLKTRISKLLDADCTRVRFCLWSTCAVDKELWWGTTIDYEELNGTTVPDSHPFPRTDDSLHQLCGSFKKKTECSNALSTRSSARWRMLCHNISGWYRFACKKFPRSNGVTLNCNGDHL